MTSKTPSLRIRIRQNASVKEKTLIRVVAETLKKLVYLYQVKNAEEILTSFEIQALRYKLKECLSRLMFLEPLEFGQKAEDTIWKSIFYEPIRIFKKELKSKPTLTNSKSMLFVGFKRHILGAIGYYQKLIMRLQIEYGSMGLDGLDFSQTFQNDKSDSVAEVSPALKSWSFSCIQHCLLYIGDLYRYEHDIKSPHSRSLAIRYYNLVLQLNPSLGHAYNQLATLDTLSYYGLNAAYYYLKAQLCVDSFAQAKDNLIILFERNVKRLRNVIDRESLMKKSGSNMSRGSLKVLRVKSIVSKYLNLWHSFSTSAEMDNHEAKQLAIMCDDLLNNLSYVLGFDRKLVSDSGTSTGIRPSSLNCKTVSQILFMAFACLESMWHKNDQDEGNTISQNDLSMFDMAHTLTLNLYGHVFNQCLVRIRDEIRATNIDISVLFRRYNNQETESVTNEECDEATLSEVSTFLTDQATEKPKRKKKALCKRLVRTRQDTTEEQSLNDDLSEDENVLSENDNVLWDDMFSDSSESDNGKGFGFTESEYETEFESDEEIHSQDEDDQIIRAIVGSSTVFGRQQSNDKEARRSKGKDMEKMMYTDSVLTSPQTENKRSKQKSQVKKDIQPKLTVYVSPAPQTLIHCIYNIDLLQSLTVFFQSMHHMSTTTIESFHRVWNSAPYLWKHFAVLLNFCENLLDDISNNSDTGIACAHILPDVRKVVAAVLPEDDELKGSLLTLKDESAVVCSNVFHQAVSRLNRVIRCGLCVANLPNGPLMVQKNGNGRTWLFSHSHNAPRANLVSKSWTHICNNTDNQVTSTTEKEKFMREMARLRLEKELSSNSESEDTKDGTRSRSVVKTIIGGDTVINRAVYLVPDVTALCTRLDMIKSLVRSKQYIVIIPQAVLQKLDKLKTKDHGARQVSKFMEEEMQHNNEHLKIESASPCRVPDIVCDLISEWSAIESSAVRLAQLATPASVSGCDVVVTIVTDKASQLSPSLIGHYSKLRVDFRADMDL